MAQHTYHQKEIEQELEQTGFEITNIFGDFDKSSYSKESPRIVFIATKP